MRRVVSVITAVISYVLQWSNGLVSKLQVVSTTKDSDLAHANKSKTR